MKANVRVLSAVFFLFAMSLFIHSAAMAGTDVVQISCAANLTDALKKIGNHFNKTKPGVELRYNFGASGALAKQIDNGAPADIFISANTKWMDHLVTNKKVVKESVRDIAGNDLVVVSLKVKPFSSLADISAYSRIAMGSPGSVPVGEYTEQALKASGLYDSLSSQNKLVLTKDVRQALLYADRGEVDLAFVYKTDALLAQNAKIVFTVPSKLHDPIVFNMALTVEGQTKESAKAFFNAISSKEARAVLESFGYTMIASPVLKK